MKKSASTVHKNKLPFIWYGKMVIFFVVVVVSLQYVCSAMDSISSLPSFRLNGKLKWNGVRNVLNHHLFVRYLVVGHQHWKCDDKCFWTVGRSLLLLILLYVGNLVKISISVLNSSFLTFIWISKFKYIHSNVTVGTLYILNGWKHRLSLDNDTKELENEAVAIWNVHYIWGFSAINSTLRMISYHLSHHS